MRKIGFIIFLITVCFPLRVISQQTPSQQNPQVISDVSSRIKQSISEYVAKNVSEDFEGPFPKGTKLQSVTVTDKRVQIYFNDALVYQPVRQSLIDELIARFTPLVSPIVPDAEIHIYAGGRELEQYIPGVYNPPGLLPEKLKPPSKPPLIQNASFPAPKPSAGLYGHYVCLWHSHGFYYDSKQKRWQWQRPRMFTIVEDKLPMSFTIPFLMPMLEKAGAIVFCPRERDIQVNEVLVDDADGRNYPQNGIFELWTENDWREDSGYGFKNWLAPYPDNINPHQQGHHRIAQTVAGKPTAFARWTPLIPESGRYAVYVSYNASPDRAPDAHYVVYHAGGATEFRVNQQMCGNYWVYLGHFYFNKGMSPATGSVVLANDSSVPGTTISADCVKFGGGKGNVVRENTVSGYPRYLEGARYWLQYAGVIPHLVYKLGFNGKFGDPDYVEDYSSRPEWVNYLVGSPSGPNPDRNFPGLGVPVDVSIAFHTDAGIKDGVVGTLLIYRIMDQFDKDVFPDGRSRWLNRDLADLIQTQIVQDIRAKYSSTWTRRRIHKRDLAEVRRPNIPSALIELLSHQNFDDMKYALDPRFRFDVSRAIYKAILRFIAYEYGYEPVIAPLAPKFLSATTTGAGKVALRWEPQPDPLEPTAVAEGYILYVRKGENADFDNGTYVTETAYELEGLEPNEIYSFRVSAVNQGGESFPSEVLSVYTGTGDEPRALIVNAFDRIAPPEYIEAENYRGVNRHNGDWGVPYLWNLALTGDQWDFDPGHKFLNNDNPGWGASYGNLETSIELGNTFDFTIIHGSAMKHAGWSFDSVSDDAVRAGIVNLADYKVVDWLLGEERTTPPPPWRRGPGSPDKMTHEFQTLPPIDQEKIKNYLAQGGRLFISGAYVGTDLVNSPIAQPQDKQFLEQVLKCEWITNNGSKTNNVFPVLDSPFDPQKIGIFHISSGVGENGIYGVELPDSLRPAKDSGAKVALRYQDAYFDAGVYYDGTDYKLVVFGFPFECIVSEQVRQELMSSILSFLTK